MKHSLCFGVTQFCCCHVQEVLDWFSERKLHAYSISAGQSLLYNDIFPKHKERLGKKMSELVVSTFI